MCAVQGSFKHWTAARRRIDYPIRECPVWRKATGDSGSQADIGQVLVSAKKRSLDYTVSTETRKKESARSTGPTSPAQTSSP